MVVLTTFSRSIPCLYCPVRLRGEQRHLLHRQEAHALMDFGCRSCAFTTPFAEQLARHLVLAHQVEDAAALSGGDGIAALAARGLARLPADLRCLRCRLCASEGRGDRILAAQDRVALRSHVERSHGGLRIGLRALKYECRICSGEFARTEEFLAHPCCEANGQNRFAGPRMKPRPTNK